MSCRLPTFVAICLATLIITADAVLVPHSAKLHRRLTYVAQAPPANWASASLEDYQQYHFRYLALGCHQRKGQTFFDTCCHPRLKTENMKDIPLECNLDAPSMVKALYIIKASSLTGNVTAGQEGKPVFVPNGTIRALEHTVEGCNSSQVPTAEQAAHMAQISHELALWANSSQLANYTHAMNSTMNSTDFANLTQFLSLNTSGMANYTHFLPANLTRLLRSNLTLLSNVTACKPSKVSTSNHTDISKPIQAPKQEPIIETTVEAPVAPVQSATEVVDRTAQVDTQPTDVAAVKAKSDADAKSKSEADAKAKVDADAKVKADADAKAKSDAEEKAKFDAEEKAKSDAEEKAKSQAAADDKAASQAQAAADAKAKSDAQAAADAKAAADQKAAAKEQEDSKPVKSLATDISSTASNALSGLSKVFGADGAAKATYFFQEGGIGACGTANSDSTPLVALPPGLYANGAHCGKSVKIINTSNGQSVTAKVQDMCPGCPSATSLDMSTGAYDAIGSRDTGVLPIQWGFM
ncbi:hypothetical protein PCASD_11130 [Puccinia coronata f. sp. avenae]|uniref:RlpA-like protein double-psi beta-barrel domain-containing protein n=1 Tax=Puccinia coronata f. sp. avenae TaxID=200324 RepID=A0A2N5UHG0_9BASI|nr:hypothetical protein PCASD_11130 [Puccinia coronata f. sp. avenae]